MPKPKSTTKSASEGIAPTVVISETTPNVAPKNRRGHNLAQAWKPGQSGNPAGRPKGSRHKLETSFIDAMVTAFDEGGVEAIRTVRDNDPAAFLNVIAKVLPKQVEAKVTLNLNELSDDELAHIATGGGYRAAETQEHSPLFN